jgi:general secretion pathway protein H
MLTLVAGKTTSLRAFAWLDWQLSSAVRCRPHACHYVCCAAPSRGRGPGFASAGGSRVLGRPGSARQSLFQRGFTLLELLVVIAIIAIGTAGVSLALRDSNTTALEREAQRLAAVLEAGRSQSRTTGLPVRWQANADGFLLTGNIGPDSDKVRPWLTAGVTAQTSNNLPAVLLGPEPIIAAQSVILRLEDRRIYITTDGLQPFRVNNNAPVSGAPGP